MTNGEELSRRTFLGAAAVAGTAALGLVDAASAAEAEAAADAPRLPLRILLRAGLPPQHLQQLRSISPQINLIEDGAAASGAIADAQVIFGSVRAAELADAKQLRWVECASAGVEHLPLAELIARDVLLTNAKGCYAPEIAEHALGLLFGL